MKTYVIIGLVFFLALGNAFTQALPTGDPADFKVKTCLQLPKNFWTM